MVSRHDYLPFGEEVGAGVGGRTTGMGFPGASDNVRQRFSGKERDVETGLDYFGARYNSSTQGRFTSPDPVFASAKPGAPQSWNRYAYVQNNPLAFIDPDGMITVPNNDKSDKETEQQRQQQQQRTVYIFVLFTPQEQQTTIVNSRGATVETVPGPNFQSLVDNAPAGVNVQLSQGANATLAAFNAALQDPNVLAVIFIGHGADVEYPATPFTADGINFGMTEKTRQTFMPDQPVDVKAQTVAVFACDSQNIAGSFQTSGTQAGIGMNSGQDRVTSTPALTQAGYAAARQLIQGRGPDAARAAADRAVTLRNSHGDPVWRMRIRGDSVRRIH